MSTEDLHREIIVLRKALEEKASETRSLQSALNDQGRGVVRVETLVYPEEAKRELAAKGSELARLSQEVMALREMLREKQMRDPRDDDLERHQREIAEERVAKMREIAAREAQIELQQKELNDMKDRAAQLEQQLEIKRIMEQKLLEEQAIRRQKELAEATAAKALEVQRELAETRARELKDKESLINQQRSEIDNLRSHLSTSPTTEMLTEKERALAEKNRRLYAMHSELEDVKRQLYECRESRIPSPVHFRVETPPVTLDIPEPIHTRRAVSDFPHYVPQPSEIRYIYPSSCCMPCHTTHVDDYNYNRGPVVSTRRAVSPTRSISPCRTILHNRDVVRVVTSPVRRSFSLRSDPDWDEGSPIYRTRPVY